MELVSRQAERSAAMDDTEAILERWDSPGLELVKGPAPTPDEVAVFANG
jgi:hypothetical protein